MTSDDLAAQLHQLQNLRSLGVIGDAAYGAGLTTLRSRYSNAAVDALLRQDSSAELARDHAQTIGGSAQVGVAGAGDVRGSVVAPLFPEGASGNYVAGVINIFQHSPAAPKADYEGAQPRKAWFNARDFALPLYGRDISRPCAFVEGFRLATVRARYIAPLRLC